MLKEHDIYDKYAWLAQIPSILVFGGIWIAAFHFIFNMAEVGAIIGVGHCLLFSLAICVVNIRLDIKDLKEQLLKRHKLMMSNFDHINTVLTKQSVRTLSRLCLRR
jgi:hypothetical protein